MNDDRKRGLTFAEWGVVCSLIMSGGALVFTAGVLWGDVQRNSERLSILEPKVENLAARIERIDANVQWLVERAQAQDDKR